MIVLISALSAHAATLAHDKPAMAHYLANEGLMVANGETKILFDPLFNEDYGQYRLVPAAMRRALMDGEPPWNGIDAVFISHYHDDHFAPADLLEYLRKQSDVCLYAPQQAVNAMRDIASDGDDAVFARMQAVALDYGDTPRVIDVDGLLIEAVRIPHSGWPSRRVEVENLAWRVTLDGETTVLHLGDADTRDVHYARDEDFWEERQANMAFPPYWYFLAEAGRQVLDERLRPMRAIGIHVPDSIPGNDVERQSELRGVDLFTRPGETRAIPHRH